MFRVTRSEAARRLGLHKSTMSRLCRDNPQLLDANGLVDVNDVLTYRQATLNPKLQTRGPDAGGGSGRRTDPPLHLRSVDDLNASRARAEHARASEAELKLAERLGQTLKRSEVEAAVLEVGSLMWQRSAQVAKDQAERLAGIVEARAMEMAVLSVFNELMGTIARDLQASLSADAQQGVATSAPFEAAHPDPGAAATS